MIRNIALERLLRVTWKRSIEESLTPCVPTPSTQSDVVYIAQLKEDVIKARAECNDALNLVEDVAEIIKWKY